MSNALAATRSLLDALHPAQNASDWLAQFTQTGVAWDDLAVRAIVLGLAPQLYRQLTTWGLAVPPRTAAKLAVTHQAQAKRNEAIYHQLDDILAACAAHRVHPVALKGVHLAAHWYAEPALRPMNDIDLLFAPADMPAVDEILTGLGYQGKYKSAEFGPGITKHTSTYRRPAASSSTPNPYLSTTTERTVEPHTSLEESWFGLRVDITPGMVERAITVQLGSQPCRVLANEDLLLHLCVHFCFHLIMGAPTLVQLTDLLVVTSATALDWPVFTSRVIAYRAAPYALAALNLAHTLLAAPVPEAFTAELARHTPPSLRHRIMRLELADVLRRSQQKPLTTIPQRLWRGLQDRAETARWAPDWSGRWRVWRTALQAGRSDTGRLLLGRTSQS